MQGSRTRHASAAIARARAPRSPPFDSSRAMLQEPIQVRLRSPLVQRALDQGERGPDPECLPNRTIAPLRVIAAPSAAFLRSVAVALLLSTRSILNREESQAAAETKTGPAPARTPSHPRADLCPVQLIRNRGSANRPHDALQRHRGPPTESLEAWHREVREPYACDWAGRAAWLSKYVARRKPWTNPRGEIPLPSRNGEKRSRC